MCKKRIQYACINGTTVRIGNGQGGRATTSTDVNIPLINLPINPGKNAASVKRCMNELLKIQGYHTAQNLTGFQNICVPKSLKRRRRYSRLRGDRNVKVCHFHSNPRTAGNLSAEGDRKDSR
jgi:hypothetical protein